MRSDLCLLRTVMSVSAHISGGLCGNAKCCRDVSHLERERFSSHFHPSQAELSINKVMPLSSLRFEGERHTGKRVVIISETSCLKPA